jgi:hypothetical protein
MKLCIVSEPLQEALDGFSRYLQSRSIPGRESFSTARENQIPIPYPSIEKGEPSVNINFLRPFWFGEKVYSDTTNHPHYHTIRFANRPNIDAHIWLTILSPGATYSGGAVTAIGHAAAGIKSFTFVDDNGQIQSQTLNQWEAHVRITRVVDLTVTLHVRLAWAKAEGTILYWT